MDLPVRYAIPGRVRLHASALYQGSSFTDAIIAWLRKQAGIKRARINRYCASPRHCRSSSRTPHHAVQHVACRNACEYLGG
jgi:hypothetical protein